MPAPLITVPSISDALASTTAQATPVFQALFPVAMFVLGIVIGGIVVGYLVRAIYTAITKVTGRGRRGGGRRRRR